MLSKLSRALKRPAKMLALLAVLATVTGCAMQPASPAASWLTPEPLAVSYRTELAIARLTEILYRAELTDEQSARLYYDRGVMYDSVGLRSLARLDFTRAIRLKPDLADAYNFIGIHYTVSGYFEQAFEAFDSALELAPDHDFAYLNRGIALYYADRPDLALVDFEQFYQTKPNDPYRVLWRYLGATALSATDARAVLKQQLTLLNTEDWATNLVRFYAGMITETQLLNSVAEQLTGPQLLAERLCEVYFYLAKWHDAEQRPEQALRYYKMVLATNVFEFVEHRYARVEIARLQGETLTDDAFAEP
ncbi:lipoprotein NlpI [Arsukibacterium sp.]|uniref:lipoprotein NlpI n=1 Tax=Arsukibacterium sp. TaxID=1977258 RepID=UPI002FD8868F